MWHLARIELETPGSAIRHASVVRDVTDCTTQPGSRVSKDVNYVTAVIFNLSGISSREARMETMMFNLNGISSRVSKDVKLLIFYLSGISSSVS